MIKDDEAAIEKAEQFCRKHGIQPGFKFTDPKDGPSVFSRIGGTGRLICHPEGDPDTQSSWAMTPEAFAKRYLKELALPPTLPALPRDVGKILSREVSYYKCAKGCRYGARMYADGVCPEHGTKPVSYSETVEIERPLS